MVSLWKIVCFCFNINMIAVGLAVYCPDSGRQNFSSHPKMKQIDAEILKIEPVAKDIFRLTLKAPDIAEAAAPGQFVMIRPVSGFDPLLPRPFSLHDWSEKQGTIVILFRVVGKGTGILAQSRHGRKLQVVGPLGKGFDITSAESVCLVGGGIGIAPLLGLAKRLPEADAYNEIAVLLGGASGEELAPLAECLDIPGLAVRLATDDGTLGHHGVVTDLMENHMTRDRDWLVLSCGPMPMLKAVAHLCRKNGWPCQVSLESVMACGMGVCLGCAVKSPAGNGHEGYLHVCKDGPVFWESDVAW